MLLLPIPAKMAKPQVSRTLAGLNQDEPYDRFLTPVSGYRNLYLAALVDRPLARLA